MFHILIFSISIVWYQFNLSDDCILKNNTNLEKVLQFRGGAQDSPHLPFISPKPPRPAFTQPPVRPSDTGVGVGGSTVPKPYQTSTGISIDNQRPSNRITMKQIPGPGGDPGGSGGFDFDFDSPQELQKKLEPTKVIDDPTFWNNLQTPKDSKNEELLSETSETEEPVNEPEDETLNPSPPTSPPTYQLEKDYRKQYDFRTNSKSPPVKDTNWEGQEVVLYRSEVGKANFGHPDFIDIPDDDIVPCVIQPDLTKYQRDRCAKVTDKSESLYQAAILKHVKSRNKGMVKVYMKNMPFYQGQPAIGYLDMKTGECVIFHTPNSKNELKYWSHKTYKADEIAQLLKYSLSIKYAHQPVVTAPTVPAVKYKLPPMEKNIPPKYGGEF